MSDTVIDKVFAPAGALKGVPIDHVGPSSYTQVSGAGDTIIASEIGLKNIYAIQPGVSDDGLDVVYPLFTTNKSAQSVELKWVVIATGAEVAGGVDLSSRRVRLMAWGN